MLFFECTQTSHWINEFSYFRFTACCWHFQWKWFNLSFADNIGQRFNKIRLNYSLQLLLKIFRCNAFVTITLLHEEIAIHRAFAVHFHSFCSDKIKNNNFPLSSHQTTWHFISLNRLQTFCHCNVKERKNVGEKIMRKEMLQHNIITDNKIAIHSHFNF